MSTVLCPVLLGQRREASHRMPACLFLHNTPFRHIWREVTSQPDSWQTCLTHLHRNLEKVVQALGLPLGLFPRRTPAVCACGREAFGWLGPSAQTRLGMQPLTMPPHEYRRSVSRLKSPCQTPLVQITGSRQPELHSRLWILLQGFFHVEAEVLLIWRVLDDRDSEGVQVWAREYLHSALVE